MKLIDKDKIVAEIERRITENKKDIERASHKNLEDYFEGYEDALALLKQQYLDIIEVKEVDLEKEINEWQGCEVFPEGVDITPLPKAMEIVERTAKHFFKLGLKA